MALSVVKLDYQMLYDNGRLSRSVACRPDIIFPSVLSRSLGKLFCTLGRTHLKKKQNKGNSLVESLH